jgi:hypothetical protein
MAKVVYMLEIHGNLFRDKNIHNKNVGILHCISADYNMMYGFANEIERRYHLRDFFNLVGKHKCPEIIFCDNIISLVVTRWCNQQIEYSTFIQLLIATKEECYKHSIDTLLMPRIGCGYGGLSWQYVKDDIKYLIDEFDINCIIYN